MRTEWVPEQISAQPHATVRPRPNIPTLPASTHKPKHQIRLKVIILTVIIAAAMVYTFHAIYAAGENEAETRQILHNLQACEVNCTR